MEHSEHVTQLRLQLEEAGKRASRAQVVASRAQVEISRVRSCDAKLRWRLSAQTQSNEG